MKPIEPGCLALVLGASRYAGMTVTCLHPTPPRYFTLPDGYTHDPRTTQRDWVIESPVALKCLLSHGGTRMTHFASVDGAKLLRIDGYDESTDTQDSEPVPVELERDRHVPQTV